jgi:hypothetical protein
VPGIKETCTSLVIKPRWMNVPVTRKVCMLEEREAGWPEHMHSVVRSEWRHVELSALGWLFSPFPPASSVPVFPETLEKFTGRIKGLMMIWGGHSPNSS